MIVITDTTGITVKSTIDDTDHVRIGTTQTACWVDGTRRNIREIGKPHCEFTINELMDLLVELEYLKRMGR